MSGRDPRLLIGLALVAVAAAFTAVVVVALLAQSVLNG
jgi:hypothetical protein